MTHEPVSTLIARRVARREFLGLGAAVASMPWLAPHAADVTGSLEFTEVPHGADGHHHLPPGFTGRPLLRWGDAVMPGAPHWLPGKPDADAQQTQFGYNNDYLAFIPLPLGSNSSDHGLLCVNHEYISSSMMWPAEMVPGGSGYSAKVVAAEMAAVGFSIMEVVRENGVWQAVPGQYSRRLTASTPFRIAGPAAGHERLKTAADPTGTVALGLLGPCAGGKTPWGTVLSCEENFQFFFAGKADGVESTNHERYNVGRLTLFPWNRHVDRFDVAKAPTESNRFGWVVEIDPADPTSTPVKRTALGRMCHESATVTLNHDNRVVVYLGDDTKFEYLYRYVSHERYRPAMGKANHTLLDDGELAAARFSDDGTLQWLPLVFGQGPLTPANGFHSQADVLIETRRAADLLGATPMDRPEDIEVEPATGRVFIMLTNNSSRKADQLDAVNPRPGNWFGHVITLDPQAVADGVDHAAQAMPWNVFLLAGDPRNPDHHARYPGPVSENGWFAAPDNCAFDPEGHLWIATDQGLEWTRTGIADGLWVCEMSGPQRGRTRRFFRAPFGAEVCGPEFTPDGTTLFLAIQHPATDGLPGTGYATPASRWPDFDPALPARPSVLAITRDDGRPIGGQS
ncbi:MAG: PhoX family phosphatase [Gammaproteobacteria bacterium]|nr:PhoX family phosphatase [Gammaproteobacteria bacterium]